MSNLDALSRIAGVPAQTQKIALNDAETAGALGAVPIVGPLLAALGSASKARDGYGFQQGAGTLVGSSLGGGAGMLAGAGLGAMTGKPGLAGLLTLAGGMAGTGYGAAAGNKATQPSDLRNAIYQKMSSQRDMAAGLSGVNPVIGGIYAGATAPEGEQLRTGIGTGVGGALGGLAGGIGGAALGTGGAMGLNALLDHYGLADDKTQSALLGAGGTLGGMAGGLAGGILGGGAGYDLATPKQASQGKTMKTASDLMFLSGVELTIKCAGLNPAYTKHYVTYTKTAAGGAGVFSEGMGGILTKLKGLVGKGGNEVETAAEATAKMMPSSAAGAAAEAAPEVAGGPVGSNLMRNLGIGGALAGAAGGTAYGMGDADTPANKLKNMSNETVGTNFDTQSRFNRLMNG